MLVGHRRLFVAGQGVQYYAAKSGNTTAETDAQNIIDIIHQFYGDTLGYSAPETRTDYSNFTSAFNTTNYEGLYIPSGWSGTYPGISGDITSADNTFLSIRPWYTSVADYHEVQNVPERRLRPGVQLPQVLG